MAWWIISLVVTVIVAAYFYRKSNKIKEPVWAYKTSKIIGLGTDAPLDLHVTFKNKPVNEVYRTTLIIFNRGRTAIRANDVTKPISFKNLQELS